MQHKRTVPGRRLDRRTFLKTSGMLGAAGTGLLPVLPNVRAMENESAGGEEIRYSICDMCCIGRCGIEVLVKDGRATRVQPFKDYPRGPICVKGNSILFQLYHPDRLKYPMKRTNPKGSASAAWQRISWGEALDTIAEKLAGIRQKYGPEKVLFYAGDPKDPVRPNLQRLALKFGSPNYGTESSVCFRATVLATSLNGAGSAGLTPNTKAVIAKIILDDLLVLATGTQIQKNEKGEPMPVDVYTLEVTPVQAEKLALASTQGRLQFALRNLTDTENVKTSGVTIAKILNSSDWDEREFAVPPVKTEPVKKAEPVETAKIRPAPKKKRWAPRRSVTVEIIKGTQLTKKKLTL